MGAQTLQSPPKILSIAFMSRMELDTRLKLCRLAEKKM